MYIGRYLVVGPGIGAYRVSSRSFPHRKIIERDAALTVVPTDDAAPTDNPYVSYNCLRTVDRSGLSIVAFGNGSHVDPIAEKLELGYPPRDALATSLLALDFEKDDYDTPRIAATVDTEGEAVIGTVRRDALLVQTVDEPTLVATYERDTPTPFDFDPPSAARAARAAMGHDFEHSVCAAGIAVDDGVVTTAIENGES